MDSLTQFVLGAGVGVALLGRRIGVRRAALTGGLLGTLPDLDIVLPVNDPVDGFVSHRGFSHSLLVHAAITPLLGEGIRRLFAPLRAHRILAYVAVFLILSTHAVLDALTIYGTQLFWPLYPEPLGLGSLFIIDPLYTLPLLFITLWALITNRWSQAFVRGLVIALTLSTGYAAWSVAAQQWVEATGRAQMAERGVSVDLLTATPSPFNTVFWRVIAVSGVDYYNIYVPLLGGADAVTVYRQVRIPTEVSCKAADTLIASGNGKRLAEFADGFFRIDLVQDILELADLRMGLTHGYVFRFAIAKLTGDQTVATIPPRRVTVTRQFEDDLAWLMAGIRGERKIRRKESGELLEASNDMEARRTC